MKKIIRWFFAIPMMLLFVLIILCGPVLVTKFAPALVAPIGFIPYWVVYSVATGIILTILLMVPVLLVSETKLNKWFDEEAASLWLSSFIGLTIIAAMVVSVPSSQFPKL